MWFSRLLKISVRTLYHGTCMFNYKSIKEHGLVPQVGSFVSNAYLEYIESEIDIPDLVYAADKYTINKCLGAIINCIGVNIGKSFHEVSDSDIKRYGLLVVIKGSGGKDELSLDWEQYDYNKDMPVSVESDDYYSLYRHDPDIYIRGNALIGFLRRSGVLPRRFGPENDVFKNYRELMFRKVINKYPDIDRNSLKVLILSLSKDQIEKFVISSFIRNVDDIRENDNIWHRINEIVYMNKEKY